MSRGPAGRRGWGSRRSARRCAATRLAERWETRCGTGGSPRRPASPRWRPWGSGRSSRPAGSRRASTSIAGPLARRDVRRDRAAAPQGARRRRPFRRWSGPRRRRPRAPRRHAPDREPRSRRAAQRPQGRGRRALPSGSSNSRESRLGSGRPTRGRPRSDERQESQDQAERPAAHRSRRPAQGPARLVRSHVLQEGSRVHRGAPGGERMQLGGPSRRSRARTRRSGRSSRATRRSAICCARSGRPPSARRRRCCPTCTRRRPSRRASETDTRRSSRSCRTSRASTSRAITCTRRSGCRSSSGTSRSCSPRSSARGRSPSGWSTRSRNELWPIAHEGAPPERVENIRIGSADVADPIVGDRIERVFLTGVAHVPEETEEPTGQSGLVACLPMRVDDRARRVIVIFSLFPQKDQLVRGGLQKLFKMLGLHAASALLGSSLFCAGGGKLLGADALRGLLHADEAK